MQTIPWFLASFCDSGYDQFRADLKCCWSLRFPFRSNSSSSCPCLVLLSSPCSLVLDRRLNLSVQWLGAVSACCGASRSVFGTTLALLQRARRHERPQVRWPVFGASFIHKYDGAALTSCVFALERDPVDGPVLCPRLCRGTPARIRTWLSCRIFPGFDVPSDLYGCTVSVSTFILATGHRFHVNRWVDDDRATCFDFVHQCPVGFHQSFSVGERSVSCLHLFVVLLALMDLSVSFVNVHAEAVKITELI